MQTLLYCVNCYTLHTATYCPHSKKSTDSNKQNKEKKEKKMTLSIAGVTWPTTQYVCQEGKWKLKHSLCNILHPPFLYYVKIFSSALLNCSCHNERNQDSHPYKAVLLIQGYHFIHPQLLVTTCWVAYVIHPAHSLPCCHSTFWRACKVSTVICSCYTDFCTVHTLNTTGTRALSQGKSGMSTALTTHPHLLPRLRMGKAIQLYSPSVFVACYKINFTYIWYRRSWSNVVGIPTTILDDLGFQSRQGKIFFCYPKCPDRLWGPPSPLFNGYRVSLE
jgi:hypothetical protein